MENIKNAVEALIFAAGTPIEKKYITEKIPELTTKKLESIVAELKKEYSGTSGIVLSEFNGKVQFGSNPRYGEMLAEILTPLRERQLSKTLLEVLATIAYQQPITRTELEEMRGSPDDGTTRSCEYAISGLLKAGLIHVVGRKEAVGRPFLYGTTDEFLKKFQLESLDDLPDYTEVLEKLKDIYAPAEDTLFHNRTIEGSEETEAAADVEEEEIPEFLEGEELPEDDSFGRFFVKAPCQYVNYCLRRFRKKSSRNPSFSDTFSPFFVTSQL